MAFKHKRFPHDDEARRKWQDPEAILVGIGLGPGMVFADIGCGEGFFSIPAARIVGSQGLVYALDADSEAIDLLRRAAEAEGLGNVTAVSGEGEKTLLCEACADIVFFGTVLHDFNDAAVVLGNARRMINPSGRLINLDWKKEKTELGPPVEIRFDVARASRMISEAGFEIADVRDSGPQHYVIEAIPTTV